MSSSTKSSGKFFRSASYVTSSGHATSSSRDTGSNRAVTSEDTDLPEVSSADSPDHEIDLSTIQKERTDKLSLNPSYREPSFKKNPARIVNDFVDLMDGNAEKFHNIALWFGDSSKYKTGKINSLSIVILEEDKKLLRAKINLEFFKISSKFETKIKKLHRYAELGEIEITFHSAESLGILLLLHAMVRGDKEAIRAAEDGIKLEWMPSFEYAWTCLARKCK